jgi:putative SOS response-associated peptidase YedK
MCGRYVSVAARADLAELFGATGTGDGKELAPSWNVAPTNKVYAIVERQDGAATAREVRVVR